MRIHRISQLSLPEIRRLRFGGVLVASGYESRARALAQLLNSESTVRIGKKWAWGFKEHRSDSVRAENERVLKGLGYLSKIVAASDSACAEERFLSILRRPEVRSSKSVLIDISSMTRAWYGGISSALRCAEGEMTTIFAYHPGKWSGPPGKYPANEILGPVKGFSSHSLPDKPTALIFGLGHDEDRALGLHVHLDPEMTLLFYAKPGADPRYETQVLKANKELFDVIPKENVFGYPLHDCVATFSLLDSTIAGLRSSWRLVLCSTGPKMFSLICFLLSCVNPDVSVWRVSAGTREAPRDREVGGPPTFLRVEWGP